MGSIQELGERLQWSGHQAAASLLLLPLLSLRRAAYRYEARLAIILHRSRCLASQARALARAVLPPLGWSVLGGESWLDESVELNVSTERTCSQKTVLLREWMLDEATVIFVQVPLGGDQGERRVNYEVPAEAGLN
jgi:hypothetical protein